MRFVTYDTDEGSHAGLLVDGAVLPVRSLDPALPDDVLAIIAAGPPALARIREALPVAVGRRLDLSEITLKAPIPVPPRNLFCIGKNYVEHAKEFQDSGFDASSQGQQTPDVPIIFTKAPSSVIGPGETVDSSLDPTGSLDYEGELAVVIGRGGRGIAAKDAMAHVFGYTIVNDVTARQTQHRHKQWFLGKSADTFCPMGPALVSADEVGPVDDLRLVTEVNGEVRQDAYVSDLIFDIPRLIETVSASITLRPGDILATGTPAGVAVGFTPPKYLKPGDKVEITVAGIGTLSNPIG